MKKIITYILLTIVVLIIWEILGNHYGRFRMLLSTPLLCIDYFFENSQLLIIAIFTTFIESFVGLLVAILMAFVLMILCLYNFGFYKFILPIIVGSQVIPIIVLAPFFIILIGLGIGSKILMAALISFYPIFLNFSTGYNSIKQNVHELLNIYKANNKYKVFKIYFPLALPNIFSGIKIAVPLSVIGAIVAEMAGAEKGIGLNLLKTTFRTEPELMIWSIIGSAIIAGTLFLVISLVEKRLGFWYINEKHLR